MSNKPYHMDNRRISKSGLDLIARSPYHYWYKYINPNFVWESDDTPALVLGKAIHGAILEPDRFDFMFTVKPADMDRRTKEGKEAYAEWASMNEGKKIITQEQYDTAMFMRDAAYQHPAARYLLELKGKAEHLVEWVDQQTGALCKCRTDKTTDCGWILDVKSTGDASPEGFGRSSYNYRYDVQSAFYTDGALANGITPQGFCFIAIEKEPPYVVAVYFAEAQTLDIGRTRYRKDLLTYLECKKNNEWPGYSQKAMALQLPGWATKQFSNQQNEQ